MAKANGNGEANDADFRLTEKVMTKNDTVSASIDADGAKKLARNLKKRFAELGIEICLNHAYEAVAAMRGHTNWATMKAAMDRSEGTGSAAASSDPVRHPPLARHFVLSIREDGTARVTVPPLACLDHFHVAGFAGDDKSAVLLGMAESNLELGAGFMLCDSSGDQGVVDRVRSLAQQYGREKDVTVLDLTGKATHSASLNLFRLLKPQELARVFVDIMKGSDSRGTAWCKQAVSCAAGAWEALFWMHENKGEHLSRAALKEYLGYRRLQEFAYDTASGDLPHEIRSMIKSYLENLPGAMKMRRPTDLPKVGLDAHADNVNQYVKILDRLERDFGRVLSERGSADVFDNVVDEGKILVILLPPVEYRGNPESFAGTFIHSTLAEWLSRRAAKGIARSRRGRQPYLMIFDEVDSYEVRDRDVMAMDARAAGIGLVFADYPNTLHPAASPRGSSLVHAIKANQASVQMREYVDAPVNLRVFR